SVQNGVIAHGDDLQDQDAIENFRDHVFSARTEALDLGVEDLTSDPLKIYPNPVSNSNFEIECDERLIDLTLVDISGKQITQFQIQEIGSYDLPIGLPNGVYVLRGNTESGRPVQTMISIAK
ncbi:MAG: T9SS type A sorting domain-containing protein, partial [Bacteroidetes bacterium]